MPLSDNILLLFFALLSTYYLCTSVFLPIFVCMGLLMTDAKAVKLVDTVTMFFFFHSF